MPIHLLCRAWRASLAFLLCAGCSGALLFGQVPTPVEPEEEPPEDPMDAPASPLPAGPGGLSTLEAFHVTGSHVRRLDYEMPSPVVTYTAAAIADRGYATLGEFVQSLAFNNALGNSEFTTGSFVTGAATINLRGLGSNRVLTLINGRRTVPYALTNSSGGTAQSVFDFNTVPAAAIDRVEFLKDGASAIYGSDAITGVYNIILKRNFKGSAIDMQVANTLKHDSLSRRVSLITGMADKEWDVTAILSHQSRHSNFIQDYGVKSADYRYLGARGGSFLTLGQVPSNIYLTASQATTSGVGSAAGYYVIPNAVPTANPTRGMFAYVGPDAASIPTANRYDPAKDTQLYPASETTDAYVNFTRRFSAGFAAFAQFYLHRSRTYYEFAPYSYSSQIQGFVLPTANPYNPFGFSLFNFSPPAFSFHSQNFRPKREVDGLAGSGLIGLRGTARRIWHWETAVNYGRNRIRRSTDYIRVPDLQTALSGTTRTTAYNPFGPSDNPNLIPSLFTRSVGNDNRVDSLDFDLSTSARILPIPLPGAGELGLASGFEYREESLRAVPDPNDYIGVPGSLPYDGHRHTKSVFVEVTAPLQKWLEVQVAGRHETYSDFGRAAKPKLGAKVALPENRFLHVIARASYSESFKAPDLGQLFQRQTSVLTTNSVLDPLRPRDPPRQIPAVLGGNPDLQPEEAKIQYAGLVFEVPAVKGLSFSADYFDIKVHQVISTLTIDYLVSPEGQRQFPSALVRDNSAGAPGPIQFYYGIAANLGFQLYRGWDFGGRYVLRNTRLGNFRFSADFTHIVKRGLNSGQGAGFTDATGLYFAPEWRSNLAFTWSRHQYGAALTADIIGKYHNRGFTPTGWGENIYPVFTPSFTYRGLPKTTVTLGCTNVLDHRPPPNGWNVLGFDDRAYGASALGRSVYLRVKRDL